jgi:hypothetical protein
MVIGRSALYQEIGAMALPSVPQTFAVEDAKDMVEKLWWEIESFRDEVNLEHKLWRAFNCAVTAWHITDWLWNEVCGDAGVSRDLAQFQTAVQDRCREVRLCRHIANASKHGGVDRGYDPEIEVIVEAKDEPVPFEEVGHSQHWEIIISDHGSKTDALVLFYRVYQFWNHEVLAR